jgi:Domain of unknown function (DUF4276)
VKQVAILVEGQTEEQFVIRVLRSHVASSGLWLQPIVVETSRTPTGLKARGGGGWKHYDRNLRVLLGQGHWHRIGLLVDYYAYPADGPGAEAPGTGRPRHQRVLKALAAEYPDPRFVPGLALHEFEAWVIAAAVCDGRLLGEQAPAERLREIAKQFDGDVELINDGAMTAPSKRIAAAWPGYSKTVDGVDAILSAGFEHVLALCPTLQDWLSRLTAPVA